MIAPSRWEIEARLVKGTVMAAHRGRGASSGRSRNIGGSRARPAAQKAAGRAALDRARGAAGQGPSIAGRRGWSGAVLTKPTVGAISRSVRVGGEHDGREQQIAAKHPGDIQKLLAARRAARRQGSTQCQTPAAKIQAEMPRAPGRAVTSRLTPVWHCEYGLRRKIHGRRHHQAGHVQPIWAGHPWVFAQAIERIEGGAAAGDEIQVRDARGNTLGRGLYSPGSAIPVRLFTRDAQTPIDGALFASASSVRSRPRRAGCRSGATNAALVHAEGDDLCPGWWSDSIGDVVAVQLGTNRAQAARRA